MELKHIKEGTKEKFYLDHEGTVVAFINYYFNDTGKIVIEHTEVDSAYEGKGLGKELVMAVVDLARKHKTQIKPFCPYAKRILTKSTDYADILD